MSQVTFGSDPVADPALRARLIHATGPELFDFFYDGRETSLTRLEALCVLEDGVFGTALTTAAFDGSVLVGIEHGFSESQRDALEAETGAHLKAMLSRDELRRVAWATDIVEVFIEPCAPDAYYLQNLSIVPEHRGHGFGEQLLERAFAVAADAGCAAVELDVSVGNPALRLYQRVGMEIAAERRHEQYEHDYGLKGQYHMVKRL